MKKIFIYYSLSGNGDAVADCLKERDFEIRRIETTKKFPSSYALRIIIGGYKAMVGYEEELKDLDTDLNGYEEVLIGSPVWNDRLSSPVSTALKKLHLKDKKLTFILYSGSGKALKAREFIEENYPGAAVIDLKEPKKDTESIGKLLDQDGI